MSTVGKPNPGWEDEGGVNVIEPDRARLALVVSATQKSHEQFHTLLTRLRRSRYEAKHHARPWEIDQLLPFGDVAERTTKPVERPATQVPDAELARLAVRRVPQEGRWQGERREAGARPRPLAIALGAGRVEFTAPNWIVRYDDRQAAEAHPDLGSVVLHRDIDAIRRRLDDELPWWPHRSNEELAKLYRVDDVPGEGDDRVAVLRLTPRVSGVAALANVSAPQKPGASKQGASKPVAAGPSVESAPIAFLKATFARDTGRLLRYEIHLEGRRLATLELAAAAAAGEKSPPLAVLLDASGRRLVEWRTVARDPAAKPDAAEPPPAVDAGWNDYLALDRRSPRPALDAEYHAIVTAMARGEWRVAFERLQVAVAARPERPLLRMLRGVCALNDRSLAPRPQALADLQTAAASSADGIARALATQSQFEQHLAPRELFDILSRQEEARRSLDVTLRLARLAQELDDRATALRHARRAVAQLAEGDQSEADSSETYANRRLVVELLLLGGPTDEARQAARAALADGRATIGQILMFADVFAQQKLAPIAVEVVQSQLAARTWNSAERYRLLRRAADYAEGFARVQLLFDALRTPAQGVAEQAADIDLLWMSISTADEAARLLEQLNARPVVESNPNGKPDDAEGEPAAAPSADAALLVRLLYVRAVLTTDVAESGRALLVALEKGPIPERWEDTVLGRLLEARQIGPCVAWYERQLRDGRSLEAAHRSRFAQALRQLGRDREAARVQ